MRKLHDTTQIGLFTTLLILCYFIEAATASPLLPADYQMSHKGINSRQDLSVRGPTPGVLAFDVSGTDTRGSTYSYVATAEARGGTFQMAAVQGAVQSTEEVTLTRPSSIAAVVFYMCLNPLVANAPTNRIDISVRAAGEVSGTLTNPNIHSEIDASARFFIQSHDIHASLFNRMT